MASNVFSQTATDAFALRLPHEMHSTRYAKYLVAVEATEAKANETKREKSSLSPRAISWRKNAAIGVMQRCLGCRKINKIHYFIFI